MFSFLFVVFVTVHCLHATPLTVNGGWSSWSSWTLCSKSCGYGIQRASRSCSNPYPSNGGTGCSGSSSTSRYCNTLPCPDQNEDVSATDRKPDFTFLSRDKRAASKFLRRTKRSAYEECREGCWLEEMYEIYENYERSYEYMRYYKCRKLYCPDGCRNTNANYGHINYLTVACKVNGGWSSWSSWTSCSKSCDSGTQSASRSCSNPYPSNGGTGCSGSSGTSRYCNTNACPVNGGWSSWSSWTSCSKSCDSGTQSVSRSCSNPYPSNGGTGCSGSSSTSRYCNTHKCPVNGGWTNWSGWSTCTVTCGTGTQSSTRSCSNPSPANGGNTCSGSMSINQYCNTQSCPVTCPTFGPLDHGQSTTDCLKVGCTTQFVCDTGHTLTDIGVLVCGDDGRWMGKTPQCKAVSCPTPTIDHGSATNTNYTYGNTISYTCEDGYTLNGPSSRKCDENGTWTGTQPQCDMIDLCLNLPCIFGTCSPYLGGYTCDCLQDYKGKNCDEEIICTVGAIANGVVSDYVHSTIKDNSIKFGGVISYSCNDNYVLVDGSTGGVISEWESSRTCQETGQLTGTEPRCAVFNQCSTNPCRNGGVCKNEPDSFTCDCSATSFSGNTCGDELVCKPAEIPNGKIAYSNGQKIGSTAVFSCIKGYVFQGDISVTCGKDGTWSGLKPQCKGIVCPQHSIAKGQVVGTNTSYGKSISYQCNSGYVLVNGDATRACSSCGDWTGKMPTCAATGLCSSSPCKNGGTCTDIPNGYVCSCADGYGGSTCTTKKCCITSNWSYCGCRWGDWNAWVPCTKPCNGYTYRTRSIWLYNSKDGCPFKFETCASSNYGYELKLCNTQQCQNDGTTNITSCLCKGGYTGQCCEEVITCPTDTISNGSVVGSSPYRYSDTITYTCNSGYTLEGSDHRCCGSDGQWIGDKPQCTKYNSCNTKPCSIHAKACTNKANGFQCECEAGYSGDTCETVEDLCLTNPCTHGTCTSMPGEYTCSCQDGYKGQDCDEVVACPEINLLNGKATFTGLNYGSTITYACHDGFTLTGNKTTATCGKDGTWTGTNPQCAVIRCPKSSIDNGNVTGDTYTYGNEISYKCHDGYILHDGDHIRVCGKTGAWSGAMPRCAVNNLCSTTLPCKNGASCTDLPDNYTCTCDYGYEGKTCEALTQCSEPGPFDNAVVIDQTGYAPNISIFTYACKTGFYLEAGNVLNCRLGGVWDGVPPKCSEIKCSVGNIPNGHVLEDGVLTDGFVTWGNDITYSCIDGYILVDNDTKGILESSANARSCSGKGVLSGKEPHCAQYNLCNLNPCENGASCDNLPDDFKCTCAVGYSGRTCSEVIQCEDPPMVAHAEAKINGYLPGDVVTYTCIPGYELSGSEAMECVLGGTWEGSLPVCKNIDYCIGVLCNGRGSCEDGLLNYTCHCQPVYYGKDCENLDGGWTDWSPFSLCSVTCGDGIQVATRECTNPKPENNGKKCIGSSTNAQECKVEDCVVRPEDPGYSDVCNFETDGDFAHKTDCDKYYTCKEGIPTPKTCAPGQFFSRTSRQCDSYENVDCVVNDEGGEIAGWSDWSDWSACSTSCGSGTQYSSRTCVNSNCTGNSYRLQNCTSQFCQPQTCLQLKCESVQYRRTECVFDGLNEDSRITSIDVNEQYSMDMCIKGKSFDVLAPGKMWVDGGCRATFKICSIEYYDDCTSKPCMNGGQCTDGVKTYTCQCTPDYKGDNCETAVDYCLSRPCVFGTCESHPGEYTCTCQYNYKGLNCDEEIMCPVENIEFGSVMYGDNLEDVLSEKFVDLGTSISYSCANGRILVDNTTNQILVGGRIRTCEGLGELSGTKPRCAAYNLCLTNHCSNGGKCENVPDDFKCICPVGFTGKKCDAVVTCPEVILENGAADYKNGLTYGNKLSYRCDNGYKLTDGNVTSTCSNEGTWTGKKPVCAGVVCPGHQLDHGKIIGDHMTYGYEIQYECDDGYILVGGDAIRSCSSCGEWTGKMPTCAATGRCASSPCQNGGTCTDIPNGYVCSCADGYQGATCAEEKCCLSTEYWDKCGCRFADWNPWVACTAACNGYTYRTRSVWLYRNHTECPFKFETCASSNYAYELKLCNTQKCANGGITNITNCLCTGGYTGKCCDDAVICTKDTLDNGHITGSSLDYGATRNYECNDGYQLEGDSHRCCGADGTWSGENPQCEPILCPDVTIPNGNISTTNGLRVGSIISYKCQEGYTIEGSDAATCTNDGVWSDKTPTCKGIVCPDINILNGIIEKSDGLKYASTIVYSCNRGFKMTGESTATCSGDGTWSALKPTCTVIQCPVETIDNGVVIGTSTTFGHMIKYKCNDNYILHNGVEFQTCVESGAWNGTKPRCAVNNMCTCGPCLNGASCTNLQDDFNCTCMSGYAGKACQDLVPCSTPEVVANAEIVSNTGFLPGGGSVTYKCSTGYKLTDGQLTLMCNLGGIWNDSKPQCTQITCSAENLQNGVVSASLVTFGNEVTYSCLDGYIFFDKDRKRILQDGESNRVCQENGSLSKTKPYCANYHMCSDIPCKNGADCKNYPDSYECLCLEGYTGYTCEEVIPCGDLAAVDNAKFTITGYMPRDNITYTCLEGYEHSEGTMTRECNLGGNWNGSPPNCTDIDYCIGATCFNGGVCRDGLTTYHCDCVAPYYGPNCKNLDGGWSIWSEFSDCSVTCGSGTQFATRECTNPEPMNNGTQCIGDKQAVKDCFIVNCRNSPILQPDFCADKTDGIYPNPVDCSGYYACSSGIATARKCKPGLLYSVRTSNCAAYKDVQCLLQYDQADDGWSDWSDWSQCDTPCGEGSQLSSRICYNSMFGSEKCTGDSFRLQNCSSYFCQESVCKTVKCESWQFYQAKCSVDGLGEDSKISSMAVNTQDSPALCIEDVTFGHDKTGIWVDHGCRATFDVCYIGDYNDCSSNPCKNDGKCVDGVSSYTCKCNDHFEGDNCEINKDDCEGIVCQNGGKCIDGLSLFTCQCEPDFEGTLCELQIDNCIDVVCFNNGSCVDGILAYTCTCTGDYYGEHCQSLDGGWTEWTDWSECSVTCSDGTQTATRECTNPTPEYSGKPCPGDKLISRPCKVMECALPPNTDSEFCTGKESGFYAHPSDCTAYYVCHDDTERTALEYCHNGLFWNQNNKVCDQNVDCSAGSSEDGSNGDTDCSSIVNGFLPDPNDCAKFIQCSNGVAYQKQCATGLHWNTNITGCDYPANVGCKIISVDGGWTDWSDWSDCSVLCGPGTKSSTRACTNPTRRGTGTDCDGDDIKTTDCTGYLCQAGKCVTEKCESWNYVHTQCNVSGMTEDSRIYSMAVSSLVAGSGIRCNKKSMFGYTERKGIWAAEGCRANFGVCYIEEYDDCTSNPCLNGATCHDGVVSYKCTCTGAYKGDNCENTVPCTKPAVVENSTMTPDGMDTLAVGEKITYACVFGFEKTDGDLIRTCEIGPAWSGKAPVCSIIPCANPSPVAHASFSLTKNHLKPGDSVNYVCDTGYNMTQGDTTMVCQMGGTWSGQIPVCDDIDECAATPCDVNAACVNTDGSFTCTCNTGYSGDGFSCADIDECVSTPCDKNAACANTDGSFICTCHTGYSGDGFDCQDINECLSTPCDKNAACVNTNGSFTCTCKTGYSGDGFACEDINECLSTPCDKNATCTNTDGSFICTCNTGYSGDGFACEDIDECAATPCNTNAACANTDGSFTCTCNTGYSGDGFACEDIDECASTPCDTNAACDNTDGSFTCKCNTGYSGDGFACADIDECASTPCDFNAVCTNTDGSFTCTCHTGYSGDGFNCADIDECLNLPCHLNANCTNTPGSFACKCAMGYEGDGFDCSNIDDCKNVVCQNGGTCKDGLASYVCECTNHYEGDHCEINKDDCGDHLCVNGASCVDGLSEYTCTCAPDFTGEYCGTKIDDCEGHECLNGATCVDGINSYTCTCPTSHSGDRCEQDVDFCEGVTCENGGVCKDGLWTFTCDCTGTLHYGDLCQNRDGGWGDWTDWSSCSTTCGDGVQQSTRACDNPAPVSNGKPCDGEGTQTKTCKLMECQWPDSTNNDFCNDKAPGKYANPSNCASYYVCTEGYSGTLVEYCLAGFGWNDLTKICDENVECIPDEEDPPVVDPSVNPADGECVEIDCDSVHYNHKDCNVTGMIKDSYIYSMDVVERRSPAGCKRNDSFGYKKRDNIWVNQGCRANFEVCFIREYDDCYSQPCLNGASCVDGIATYTCQCTDDFYGANCQHEKDPCYEHECKSGGTCVADASDQKGYTCTCSDGATGEYCQDLKNDGLNSSAFLPEMNMLGMLIAVLATVIWNKI